MDDNAQAAPLTECAGGRPVPLTLEECRALHEDWSITMHGEDVHCRKPPFRFKAADPDDAHAEIVRRETPWAAAVISPGGAGG